MSMRIGRGLCSGAAETLNTVASLVSIGGALIWLVKGMANGPIKWTWVGVFVAVAIVFLLFALLLRRNRKKLRLLNEEWGHVLRTKAQVLAQRDRSTRDQTNGLLVSVNCTVGRIIGIVTGMLNPRPSVGISALVSEGTDDRLRLEARTAAVSEVVEDRSVRFGSEISDDYFPVIQTCRNESRQGKPQARWLNINGEEKVRRLCTPDRSNLRIKPRSAILVCIEDNDCPPKQNNATQGELLGYYLYVCERTIPLDPNLLSTVTTIANDLLRENLKELRDGSELDSLAANRKPDIAESDSKVAQG